MSELFVWMQSLFMPCLKELRDSAQEPKLKVCAIDSINLFFQNFYAVHFPVTVDYTLGAALQREMEALFEPRIMSKS